jgi:hypothetical protein
MTVMKVPKSRAAEGSGTKKPIKTQKQKQEKKS